MSILNNLETIDAQFNAVCDLQNTISQVVNYAVLSNHLDDSSFLFDVEALQSIAPADVAMERIMRDIRVEFTRKHDKDGVAITEYPEIDPSEFVPSQYANDLHQQFFAEGSKKLHKLHAQAIINGLQLKPDTEIQAKKGGIEIVCRYHLDTFAGFRVGSHYHFFEGLAKAFRFLGPESGNDWFEDLAGTLERNFCDYNSHLTPRYMYGVEGVAEIRAYKNDNFKLWLRKDLADALTHFIDQYGFGE